MPRVAPELSALQVKRLSGQGLHFVGGVPGLALQIVGDARSWVLRVAVGGKRREIGLGGYTTANGVAEARRKALDAREKIQAGIDPVQERESARAALKAARLTGITFKQAAESYIADQEAGWSNAKHAGQWTATLETYAYPTLGSIQVADITTAHVLEVLKKDNFWSGKPETASRVRQRIEKVIAAADATAGRERLNPARWEVIGKSLPAKAKVAKVEHHAALPWQEMPGFMTKLREQAGNGARALETAILTAARSGEVRGMTWGEIDLDQKLWTIPASRMKAKREHRVPLSTAAMTLLQSLIPSGGKVEPGKLVFPGAKKDTQMSDMTLAAVLRRMKLDVTTHGFRSSFRDWAGESTAHPREVIEHALAHQLKDAAEAAYARGDLLAKRRVLMEDWATWCGKLPRGVVSLDDVKRRALGAS
jgi:integrase